MKMENKGEIIMYQPNEEVRLEVRLENDTVWLTQAQMAELFETTKQNISLHTNNIFKEGELEQAATVKDYLTVQKEGNRSIRRRITYYNLDVIISVGYRVKSIRGTQFRQWANKVLKEYLLRLRQKTLCLLPPAYSGGRNSASFWLMNLLEYG